MENVRKQLVVWSSWSFKGEAGNDKRRGWNGRRKVLVRTRGQAAWSDLSFR